mgnify:CR=1 FL=1
MTGILLLAAIRIIAALIVSHYDARRVRGLRARGCTCTLNAIVEWRDCECPVHGNGQLKS